MNKKVWTIVAAMISTSVLADQPAVSSVSSVPGLPAAAAAPASKVSSVSELRTVPLVPGPAVVSARRVNVRGRAGLIGEVIGKLTNGEPVTVIEEVALKNSKPDEPSVWAKIKLPDSIPVWVHGSFVDRSAMTVKANRLNLRGGPGENYSVLGRIERGQAIRELQAKGDWIQIEAPADAYAFVAASYLKQEAAPAIVSEPTPAPEIAATEPATVIETPAIAPATEIPEIGSTETPVVAPEITDAPTETPAPEIAAIEEPLPPRIVQREGIVRSTLSIQAPTDYALYSPENLRAINYLFSTSTNLDLSRYKGLHIIVTGEEGLDERWKNTPVITIQQIRVVE